MVISGRRPPTLLRLTLKYVLAQILKARGVKYSHVQFGFQRLAIPLGVISLLEPLLDASHNRSGDNRPSGERQRKVVHVMELEEKPSDLLRVCRGYQARIGFGYEVGYVEAIFDVLGQVRRGQDGHLGWGLIRVKFLSRGMRLNSYSLVPAR